MIKKTLLHCTLIQVRKSLNNSRECVKRLNIKMNENASTSVNSNLHGLCSVNMINSYSEAPNLFTLVLNKHVAGLITCILHIFHHVAYAWNYSITATQLCSTTNRT